MKKMCALLLTSIFLFVGCTRAEPIMFMQHEVKDDAVLEAFYDYNTISKNKINYNEDEYIEPLGYEEDEIGWISVTPAKPIGRSLRVGFSQMEVNNAWRISQNASIFAEAERLGIELIYRDAQSSLQEQHKDILELIDLEVDYIIIAPRVYHGYKESFEAARKAKIPVILVDRAALGQPGVDYVTCIKGDFIEVGRRAASILAEHFQNKKIYVFEVTGTIGSSVSRDLSKGFREIAEPLGWQIRSVDGDFDRVASVKPIEEGLQLDKHKVQAVFTHVDDSAIAAIQAMKALGMRPGTQIDEIPIVSMCGYKDAMKAIIAAEMLATIECTPHFGPIVFKYITLLEQGHRIKTRIVIPGKTYDSNNSPSLIDIEGY